MTSRPTSNSETEITGQPDPGRPASLAYWRQRIVYGIMATAISLSLFALVPAVILSIRNRFWGLLTLDLAIFVTTLAIFICRHRLTYKLLTAFILSALYCIAVVVMCYFGFLSGGPAWLFSVPVVAALLLGYRAAVASLAVNGLTLILIGLGIHKGLLAKGQPFFTSLFQAWAVWGNYMLLNGVTCLSAAILVRGLETSVDGHREMIDRYLHEKKALRQSEARYRLIAETIRDVIWTMDQDFRLTFVSPSVEFLLGFEPDEIMTTPPSKYIAPRSLKMAREILELVLKPKDSSGEKPRSVTIEVELQHKSGASVWTEMTVATLATAAGKHLGMVGVARDITDRVAAQEEKERLQEMLNRSRKMEALGVLAGGVAHDLNNVLSGIVSYPDLLLMDLPQDSPLRQPIETIKESGTKAAAIVQDLLTLARRGVVTKQAIDLNKLVREYLASPEHQKLLSQFPNASIETLMEPSLPVIAGSEIHLRKTLMNLVSNGVEALVDKGRVRIETAYRELQRPVEGYQRIVPGRYVVLRVVDQGMGISPEDLKHIFEPFFTRKKIGRSGTGLGMAVVWGTIHDHNGFIDVKSIPGQGTAIELYLPCQQQEIKIGEGSPPSPRKHLTGHGEKILVVDDIRDQRRLCRMMLEGLNYRVKTAGSGSNAIGQIEKEHFDLVILDMIMDAAMDGLDTYKEMLKIRPGQKAIIASGFAETDRVRQAMALGVKAYLKKPYTMDKLARTVRSALE